MSLVPGIDSVYTNEFKTALITLKMHLMPF